VESNNPSRSDETRGRADECGGIGLVNQHASADHRVERLGIVDGLD
jgi:hypothetical protein